MEGFGEMFFELCRESGYEKILQVLGPTPKDFFQNLDALHDHLGTIYPGMRAPSFRCTERKENGGLILHYYSERDGMEHFIIGLVKSVGRHLHNQELDVTILKDKSKGLDHVQFLVLERVKSPSKITADLKAKTEQPFPDLSPESKISPLTFSRVFPFHLGKCLNKYVN